MCVLGVYYYCVPSTRRVTRGTCETSLLCVVEPRFVWWLLCHYNCATVPLRLSATECECDCVRLSMTVCVTAYDYDCDCVVGLFCITLFVIRNYLGTHYEHLLLIRLWTVCDLRTVSWLPVSIVKLLTTTTH